MKHAQPWHAVELAWLLSVGQADLACTSHRCSQLQERRAARVLNHTPNAEDEGEGIRMLLLCLVSAGLAEF